MVDGNIRTASGVLRRVPLELVHDDIARRPVDAVVNAWNRNFIPHWLLLPQGELVVHDQRLYRRLEARM